METCQTPAEGSAHTVTVRVTRGNRLKGSRAEFLSFVKVEVDGVVLGESEKKPRNPSENCHQYDFSCSFSCPREAQAIAQLASTLIIVTVFEFLPEEKKAARTTVLGQAVLDCLPLLQGQTHFSSRVPLCSGAARQNKVLDSTIDSSREAGASTVRAGLKWMIKPTLEVAVCVSEAMVCGASLGGCNLLKVTVETAFSVPEAWTLPSAPAASYTAALELPLTAQKCQTLVFSDGALKAGGEREEKGRQKRRPPLPQLLPENTVVPGAFIQPGSMEDEDGELTGPADRCFRKSAESHKPRVGWDQERSCFLSAEATHRLRETITKCSLWPLEIMRSSAAPLAAEEVPEILFHGLVFVDVSRLLFPGARGLRGAFCVQPFSEQLLCNKWSVWQTQRRESVLKEHLRALAAARGSAPAAAKKRGGVSASQVREEVTLWVREEVSLRHREEVSLWVREEVSASQVREEVTLWVREEVTLWVREEVSLWVREEVTLWVREEVTLWVREEVTLWVREEVTLWVREEVSASQVREEVTVGERGGVCVTGERGGDSVGERGGVSASQVREEVTLWVREEVSLWVREEVTLWVREEVTLWVREEVTVGERGGVSVGERGGVCVTGERGGDSVGETGGVSASQVREEVTLWVREEVSLWVREEVTLWVREEVTLWVREEVTLWVREEVSASQVREEVTVGERGGVCVTGERGGDSVGERGGVSASQVREEVTLWVREEVSLWVREEVTLWVREEVTLWVREEVTLWVREEVTLWVREEVSASQVREEVSLWHRLHTAKWVKLKLELRPSSVKQNKLETTYVIIEITLEKPLIPKITPEELCTRYETPQGRRLQYDTPVRDSTSTRLQYGTPVQDSSRRLHKVRDSSTGLQYKTPVGDSTRYETPVRDSSKRLHKVRDSSTRLQYETPQGTRLHKVGDCSTRLQYETPQGTRLQYETPVRDSTRVKALIPAPSSTKEFTKAEKAVQHFHRQVRAVGRQVCVQVDECGAQSGLLEEEHMKVMEELNTSGRSCAFKEQLKDAVVRVVRDKVLRTEAVTQPRELQHFVSELYTFLRDHTHQALTEVRSQQDTDPRGPH
uniref:Uncharacterized protein n=1 Tax=Knipowitschia caucasica TaxID=637954 RepID=A0AAV2KW89_KNICA